MPIFPGVVPLVQGGERPERPQQPWSFTPQLLWRPQTFRIGVTGVKPVPLFKNRSLVVALEIYADGENSVRVLIGSALVTESSNSPDGVPGNNYFQLDPGRHAYIWTDEPEREVLDVAMFFAIHEELGASTQYLHCTQWQAQAI